MSPLEAFYCVERGVKQKSLIRDVYCFERSGRRGPVHCFLGHGWDAVMVLGDPIPANFTYRSVLEKVSTREGHGKPHSEVIVLSYVI
jgi:hypothetical protein